MYKTSISLSINEGLKNLSGMTTLPCRNFFDFTKQPLVISAFMSGKTLELSVSKSSLIIDILESLGHSESSLFLESVFKSFSPENTFEI